MATPQNYLAVIKVVGIGGGGVNAINRMIEFGLKGVEFVAINTDAQQLLMSDADVKLDIGRERPSRVNQRPSAATPQRLAARARSSIWVSTAARWAASSPNRLPRAPESAKGSPPAAANARAGAAAGVVTHGASMGQSCRFCAVRSAR